MSNDELFKALGMLEKGYTKMASSNAIKRATQEIEQINLADAESTAKRKQAQEVANRMAAELAATGADASQISTAFNALNPAPLKDSKDAFAQGHTELAYKMQAFEEGPDQRKLQTQGEYMLAGKRIDAENFGARATAKAEKDRVSQLNKLWNDFRDKDSKPFREAYQSSQDIDTLLSDGSTAGLYAAKIKIIRAAGDNKISNADIEGIKGNEALVNGVLRDIHRKLVGTAYKGDVNDFKKLAEALKTKSKENLLKSARAYAKQRHGVSGLDETSFHKSLLEGIDADLSGGGGQGGGASGSFDGPEFDPLQLLKPAGGKRGASATSPKGVRVAEASFHQGNPPRQGLPERDPLNESMDQYSDRMADDEAERRGAKKFRPRSNNVG